MSFQTCMTVFLSAEQRADFFFLGGYFYPYNKSTGSKTTSNPADLLHGQKKLSEYLPLCSTEENIIQVWNEMKVRK